MVIAVNTKFLLDDYLEGYGRFIYETFKLITKQHPEHQFIFFFDRPYNKRFVWDTNISPIIAGPPARHPLLWKWWYDIRVPALLRKYKADVFVSPDGFCSLRTKIPQCVVIHDLAFIHQPKGIKKSHLAFYKKYTPRFISKANRVVTVSSFSKNDIIKNYQTPADKIDVIYNGVREGFKPAPEETKSITKNKYSDGKAYFLYAGSIHPRKNLVNLLKAFSLFKKRQQSNMKLILAGRLAWKYESFLEDLKSYKYRSDVILTGWVEEAELFQLMGAAYAFVYPSLFEGFGLPVIEAMASGIPVITSKDSAMEEIAGEAALYADPEQSSSIAEKMMLIYKDEKKRNEQIEKGLKASQAYTWEKTAEGLWKSIFAAQNGNYG